MYELYKLKAFVHNFKLQAVFKAHEFGSGQSGLGPARAFLPILLLSQNGINMNL